MSALALLRTQQVFLTSRNRDAGSPNDFYITFPNSFINSHPFSNEINIDIELVEFTIPRLWYDIAPGVNNQFTLRKKDGTSAIITLDSGFYTIGTAAQEITGGGASITAMLQAKLNAALDSTYWTVTVDNKLGNLSFNAFTTDGSIGTYTFDFSTNTSPRTHELLGFIKGSAITGTTYMYGSSANTGFEPIRAPRPYNLMRTAELVLHTDIKTTFPENSLDNYGNAPATPFADSDVLATIRVNQPPRGIINYQCLDQVNTLSVSAGDLRVVRFFVTDDREIPIDLTSCEWTAVLKVSYTHSGEGTG
jgi:hypothetical protein